MVWWRSGVVAKYESMCGLPIRLLADIMASLFSTSGARETWLAPSPLQHLLYAHQRNGELFYNNRCAAIPGTGVLQEMARLVQTIPPLAMLEL